MRGHLLVLALITVAGPATADDRPPTKWSSPDDGVDASVSPDRADAPPAPREEGAAELTSTGRSVRVELLDVEPRLSCETPCTLRAPAGAHRARVDGLDRRIVIGGDGGPSRVLIRPTHRARQGIGLAMAVLGATGLTLAGHWGSPLDNTWRLRSGLAGGLLIGLAIPFITTASARVEHGAAPALRAAPLQTIGVEALASMTWLAYGPGEPTSHAFASIGLGYRPRGSSLGYGFRGRMAVDDASSFQLVGGATLYGPRLPIVQPALFVGLGIAQRRAPEVMPELLPPASADLVFAAEAQLIVEVPWPVKPRIAVAADAFASARDVVLAAEAGVFSRF